MAPRTCAPAFCPAQLPPLPPRTDPTLPCPQPPNTLSGVSSTHQLAIRGLLSMKDAAKSGESGYPHTHVHEASQGDLVEGLEAAAGGSPAAAAGQAVEAGLEPKMQVRRGDMNSHEGVCWGDGSVLRVGGGCFDIEP